MPSILTRLGPSLALILTLLALAPAAHAAREILDAEINVALDDLYKQSDAARDLGQRALGILVFPRVYKAGFWAGGAFGDGALRVGGQTVQYYRTTGVSFGFQFGGQVQTQVVMFLSQAALDSFRASENWQAGVDGSIAVVKLGVGKSVDTETNRESIVGFIYGNKGLMADLSFKGAKYWKIVAE